MKRKDLDRIFNPTPGIFAHRIDTVLHDLKEDEPVKKFTLRTGFAALAFTLLFCSIAFAVVLTQGQEWYYNNRFTAYQENDPALQQAIMARLQTDVPQEPSHDTQSLVDVNVQDYAWIAEKNLLTISFHAQLKDSGKYELHAMTAMDPDGYWSAEPDPGNPEGRTEHWLSAKKGFGPPADVMADPAKALLLADIGSKNILIGDSNIPLYTSSYDSFTGESGAVISVMEISLAQLPEFVPAKSSPTPSPMPSSVSSSTPSPLPLSIASSMPSPIPGDNSSLHEGDSGNSVRALQQVLADKGYYHGDIHGTYDESVSQAVKDFQKAHGLASDGIAGPVTQTILFQVEVPAEAGAGQADAAQDDPPQSSLNNADSVKAAIAQYTDKNGMLTLRLPYQIVPFENGGFLAPADGVLTFKVKVR